MPELSRQPLSCTAVERGRGVKHSSTLRRSLVSYSGEGTLSLVCYNSSNAFRSYLPGAN